MAVDVTDHVEFSAGVQSQRDDVGLLSKVGVDTADELEGLRDESQGAETHTQHTHGCQPARSSNIDTEVRINFE